jgi:hypothetical protein
MAAEQGNVPLVAAFLLYGPETPPHEMDRIRAKVFAITQKSTRALQSNPLNATYRSRLRVVQVLEAQEHELRRKHFFMGLSHAEDENGLFHYHPLFVDIASKHDIATHKEIMGIWAGNLFALCHYLASGELTVRQVNSQDKEGNKHKRVLDTLIRLPREVRMKIIAKMYHLESIDKVYISQGFKVWNSRIQDC